MSWQSDRLAESIPCPVCGRVLTVRETMNPDVLVDTCECGYFQGVTPGNVSYASRGYNVVPIRGRNRTGRR